jgi:hypothetical protein
MSLHSGGLLLTRVRPVELRQPAAQQRRGAADRGEYRQAARTIKPPLDAGSAMIRRGRTRLVVLFGAVAIKIAIGERGLRCNRFEADLYKRVSAERRDMLCPVLWCASAGSVLVARRADREITEQEKLRLMDMDGFPDWDYMPPSDEPHPFEFKASDWGWLDGRLVALDYSAPALFENDLS